ncbi:MAG: MOSC N-terminal beta barrel domain-containing protein [Terracoccus sp.]
MTEGGAAPGLGVVALTLYPVKSLAGVAVETAAVDRRGLVGDRHWAVVDPVGGKVTAREVPAMLGLLARPEGAGGIRLEDRDGGSLSLRPDPDAGETVVSFSGQASARVAGPQADAWLSARLGRALRLVWQDESVVRPVRVEMGGREGDTNSFSDAAPLHVTTEASLDQLNAWLAESGVDPLGHDRFRPNVVVAGGAAFDEDAWQSVRIGEVGYRSTMICDRCVMTTIDRQSLRGAKEPIRTLARHRRWEGATWFGIRLTPKLPVPAGAMIAVGDEVIPHS